MLFVLLWIYVFFVCWNHRLYRAYSLLTWRTLYRTMEPAEWRLYRIDEAVRGRRGWIDR